jgi:hypothetical protein
MNIIKNELFKISDKAEEEIEIITLGDRKSKVCRVHNVFEYPDDVYNFITTHPVELNNSWDSDFYYEGPLAPHYTPGYTGLINIEARPLRRFMNWVLSQHYLEKRYFKTLTRINAFKGGTVGPKRACWPHADLESEYSGTFYLDKKNLGGTAFYRFKNDLEEYPVTKWYTPVFQEFLNWESHWSMHGACEFDPIDNDDNWEMIHLEPVAWNKAVIYEARLFHNVYVKPEMYQDDFRTSINIFTHGSKD